MIARTGMGIGIRMGQKERDSQNRTGRTGQAKRACRTGQLGIA
jgi:hypothetical protein